ncbi:ribose ABC transporter [Salmonella enterica subsp. enterica]|nr:ribose ABC transporter [Salmonella enterica subsp. enterica serovar Enteritidis]
MLKGLDPILTGQMLLILQEMGHGDELVIADANFPAYAMGPSVVDMPGLESTRVLEAVLSLLPLDEFVDKPAGTMAAVHPGDADAMLALFQKTCDAAEGKPVAIEEVERFAFYERARDAYAIVLTGERRLYGNIIVKKGVVRL